ncbi:hypothetical protein [Pelomonas sp. SE-A7]|uniref:hypothetical protein n=1 Tax=Pelomonas sp. SE-A7 TaxID=3054953 RepID=UPI00259C8506|nr:hypothetical protein [Pelomonas sp. SE-A7]MDM4767272.1 hypothetical protein [Pelomonas sp. SE-A7]
MKTPLLIALIAAIAGQVLYHLAQKSVSAAAHPVLSLLAFYALAALMSLPLFLLFPLQTGLGEGLRQMNWATVGVALSIVLVEVGFLLVYRAGGSLQTTYIVSALISTAALVLLGWLFYSEVLSGTKIAGLCLALAGIWLLSRPVANS